MLIIKNKVFTLLLKLHEHVTVCVLVDNVVVFTVVVFTVVVIVIEGTKDSLLQLFELQYDV